MEIAGWKISQIVTEHFRLDGGAMFGAVPKTLWSKLIDCDELNRIPLACRLLVLEGHGKKVLVDVGCGRKWSEKFKEIYSINYLTPAIHEVVKGVDVVLFSHLHFDHGAGATYVDGSGNIQLSFPKAEHILQKSHWEHANAPGAREQASYLPENIKPLENAKLRLVSDNEEVLPNIKVHVVNGHTKGLQWIEISDAKSSLAYVSDLIPTSRHLPVPYVMGYDLHAEKAMEEKENFLNFSIKNNTLIVFEHDADRAAAKAKKDEKGRFGIAEVVDLPVYKS